MSIARSTSVDKFTIECGSTVDNSNCFHSSAPSQSTFLPLLTLLAPSMTTVERYPQTQLQIPSDVPSNVPRSHSPSNTIARNNYIPPAVPSPPRLSARSSPPRRPHIQAKHEHTIGMASEASNQWLFTDAELVSTPSVLDGLPIAEERCRRAKGVNFIFQAGILLKLPQLTLATASVFFHRFYMRASMVPEKGGLHHYVCPPISSPLLPFQLKPEPQNLLARDPEQILKLMLLRRFTDV